MKKGFTLIELLIVIGILAILATVVVVVLNPAQLFAQARDSQRISDMTTLRSALSLYLATYSTPSLGLCTSTGSKTGVAVVKDNTVVIPATGGIIGLGLFGGASTTTIGATSTSRAIDGTGWVDVDFTDTSGGSPLSVLPTDPIGTATYFYGYACTGTVFELDANMESSRYASGGGDDVESKDGGDRPHLYEVGTDPGLDL